MSFEEWWREENFNLNSFDSDEEEMWFKSSVNRAYKAGVASRQGEVDELRQALNSALQAAKNVCVERDELQKRIDDALEILEYNEYVDSAIQALEILKGENNG